MRFGKTSSALALTVVMLSFVLAPVTVPGQGGTGREKSSNGNSNRSSTARGPSTTKLRTWKNEVGIELVMIPSGEFMMGTTSARAAEGDAKPVHRVVINQPFFIGQYEVTQSQWRSVMGDNPSNFQNCESCPVENISWVDAQAFLAKLNSRNDGYHYRLPTEAEWEYSCRAGTTGSFAGNRDSMAWWVKNSARRTHPVGQRKPNGWGLYDMHGNVREWCQDWYRANYSGAPSDGSPWETRGESDSRVTRGGSWDDLGPVLASTFRAFTRPDDRDEVTGFRVVAVPRT